MTKTLLALSLALSLPALANDDPACVPSRSATGDSIYYTPEKNTPTHHDRVYNRSAAVEHRNDWWRKHMVNEPILGNMANAPGTSALSYMHGTDNPQGHLFLDSDEGPSAVRNRSTAGEESEDNF